MEDNNLVPVETDQPIAPDSLLNMVSCSCKADGCGSSRHAVAGSLGYLAPPYAPIAMTRPATTRHHCNHCWMRMENLKRLDQYLLTVMKRMMITYNRIKS